MTELIPLSYLALDYERPVGVDWAAELTARGVAVVVDDLGRKCISRAAARELFAERREAEARQREQQTRIDIEHERLRLSRVSSGIPWYDIPAGVLPAAAMAQAARDAEPRRVPSAGEWMFQGRDEVTGGTFAEPLEEAS